MTAPMPRAWLLLLMLAAVPAGCSSVTDAAAPDPARGTWSRDGLDGRRVHRLATQGEWLLAGTDSGVYARRLDAAGGAWLHVGLAGRRIRALLPLDGAAVLVAADVPDAESQAHAPSLHRTVAGAWTWTAHQGDFGPAETPNAVFSLARTPGGALVAGGYASVIARSGDGGAHWEKRWGDWWAGGLGTHTLRACGERLWGGGEGGYFKPFAVTSTDDGATWTATAVLPGGGDNAVNELLCDPLDPDGVYAGLEGRLVHSADGGRTWRVSLQPPDYPYFFGLGASLRHPGRIYAAGSPNRETQPTVLHVSDRRGRGWRQVSPPASPPHGGVLGLLVRLEQGRDVVYLGTASGTWRFVAAE